MVLFTIAVSLLPQRMPLIADNYLGNSNGLAEVYLFFQRSFQVPDKLTARSGGTSVSCSIPSDQHLSRADACVVLILCLALGSSTRRGPYSAFSLQVNASKGTMLA